jgi:hypothetical protein
LPPSRHFPAAAPRALNVPYFLPVMLGAMPLTVRDLRVAEARWREVHANVDAIGQALDAWNRSYSAKLANLARVQLRTDAIGQALETWNRSYSAQLAEVTRTWNRSYSAQLSGLAHVQLQSAAIGQVLDAWDQSIRDQLSHLVPADVQSDAIGQTVPGLERPPAAQIAIRALVLTLFVLLIAALWEETKDSPAEAIKGVLELIAMWYALDLWIWRRLS